jgi:Raf kinase inhibitor-like YbhB/YbcL family protein
MPLTLTSDAFAHGADIPPAYTCDGSDISPPLKWSGVPANAKSLVLIADDPDAPDPKAPRMTWVHWVVYNLPPTAGSLSEGAELPAGVVAGTTDFKHTRYGGPCPPIGKHRYFFKLYALDTALPNLGPATKAQVEKAMAGHVLEQAQLLGTYQRRR